MIRVCQGKADFYLHLAEGFPRLHPTGASAEPLATVVPVGDNATLPAKAPAALHLGLASKHSSRKGKA